MCDTRSKQLHYVRTSFVLRKKARTSKAQQQRSERAYIDLFNC